MERTYEISKSIKLADGRENSGVSSSKLDVAERDKGDMNRQLAQVASTKFGDIHTGLLDEIFQSVYFSRLLGIRRVCKVWYGAISRKSAPFLRNVVLSMNFLSRSQNFWEAGSVAYPFWRFADATALVVCGTMKEDFLFDPIRPLFMLWGSYQAENQTNNVPLRVRKATYANMLVDCNVFRFHSRKVGFQTVLYRSTLKLVIGDIFPYKKNPHFHSPSFSDRFDVVLKVTKFASYTLKEADLEQMKDTWAYWSNESGAPVFNPVAEQLARKHCTRLLDSVLVVLADGTVFEHTRSVAVQDLVKQLITSFDPGNVKALDLYDKGDVIGFAKAARPLVSVLLHRFLQYDMKTIR